MIRSAYCKGCGYNLEGIGAGVCPECARAFDPDQPDSYDTAPRRTRRRRLIRRGTVILAILAVIGALFPRGYAEGRLTILTSGGGATQFIRIQPIPPRWLTKVIPARYPGWTRKRSTPAPLVAAAATFFHGAGYRLTLKGWECLGTCTASAPPASMGGLTLNGFPIQPENAGAIFEAIVPNIAAGRSFGVHMGTIKNGAAENASP